MAALKVGDKVTTDHIMPVGGLSYGQGSSREHAAICPMYLGVRAVVARSLELIHAANLVNFGILSLTFAEEAEYEAVQQGDELWIPEVRRRLVEGQELVLQDRTRNREIRLCHTLSATEVEVVLAGGRLAGAGIEQEGRKPYGSQEDPDAGWPTRSPRFAHHPFH